MGSTTCRRHPSVQGETAVNPNRARVVFLLDDLEVEAPTSTRLSEVVEKSGADITFGCKSGTCGTCRIRIVEGSQNLTPPSREERDFLKKLHRPDNERLACQCQVLGDVSIEYLGG